MPKSKVRKKNDFTIKPVSRTPVKVKAGPSSVWFVVLFVGLMLIGLIWLLVFQLAATDGPEAHVVEVWAPDLKAVFFVKDLAGNPRRVDSNVFDPDQLVVGRKVRVLFQDGELLVGSTDSFDPARKGFFFVPADANSNIERCYVVVAATREIAFL